MSTTAKESAADCTKRACSDFKNWEAKHMRVGAAVPGSSGAGGANAAKATSGLVVPPAKPVDPPGYNQCPPDGPELGACSIDFGRVNHGSSVVGRSTWTFLHSFAAYYPKQPTPEQKKDASNLVTAVSTLYPCSSCADHLQLYLKRFPVDVNDQPALSKWMCEMVPIQLCEP